VNLGALLISAEQPDRAAVLLEKAIELVPKCAVAFLNLGMARAALATTPMHWLATARHSTWNQATQKSPGDWRCFSAGLRQTDEAAALYQQLLAAGRRGSLFGVRNLLIAAGRTKQAAESVSAGNCAIRKASDRKLQ